MWPQGHAGEAPFRPSLLGFGLMSTDARLSISLLFVVASLIGCDKKEEDAPKPEPVKSAAPVPTPPPAPVETAPPPPEEPRKDCPEGSSGVGSFEKPCEAKGAERMMEVAWTGKMGDGGAPSFRAINKSKLVILYGKIVVYFYDKAGKQLEVPAGASGKPHPHQDCSGNIFQGVMKPGEKAVLTFSCVGKSHVPEGTAAIEAEMRMVGFADADGKKNEFYWKNDDLTPDAREKGGIKAAKKKK
jgi:hypothetical protein